MQYAKPSTVTDLNYSFGLRKAQPLWLELHRPSLFFLVQVGVSLLPEKIGKNFSLVASNFKGEWQKVIPHTGRSIDLDPSQQGNLSIATDLATTLGNNLVHEFGLGIEECQGQFYHLIVGTDQTMGMGEQHVVDKALLGIQAIRRCRTGGGALVTNISSGGGGTSTTSTTGLAATTFDGSDRSLGVDSDMRTIDDQSIAAIGDVGRKGPKAGHTTKGKAGESSHVEVVAIDGTQFIHEWFVDFIATKGCGQQGGRVGIAVFGQFGASQRDQSMIGQGVGEAFGNAFDG